MSETTDDLIRVYQNLKGGRGTWEQHWEEIAERILPRQIGFIGERTAGEKRTQKVFDSKPIVALERFSAICDSLLTPRQTLWHNLTVSNEQLKKDFEVKSWLYEVNQILHTNRYKPAANFTGQNSERWTSMGAFGTGQLFIDFDEGRGATARGLRYRCVGLRDIFILENHQGVIDTVYRRLYWTARQAAQRWGREKLPESIAKDLDNPNTLDKKHEFVHVVRPRTDYWPGRMDARGRPWQSIYIAVAEKQEMEDGGYTSFPYSFSRYVTAPEEVYGRSPAMGALPDIKMLNEMSRTDIRAVHKLVDPPILLHDDGVLGNGAMTVNMKPGGLNYGGVSKDGRQLIQPFQTGARVDINEAKMDQRRAAIDDAFFVSLFQILVDTPRMTATEALIRAQEKGMLLAPTVGRQESEALGPLIERELDLLSFHRMLPPMPQAMIDAGGEYEIVYDSPMSRMRRSEELVGVQRSMEILAPFAQLDPTVLDVFNTDRLARLTAEVSGVPTPVLNSPDEVIAIRNARAQESQAAAVVGAAQPLAGALKDVAQANALLQGQG